MVKANSRGENEYDELLYRQNLYLQGKYLIPTGKPEQGKPSLVE